MQGTRFETLAPYPRVFSGRSEEGCEVYEEIAKMKMTVNLMRNAISVVKWEQGWKEFVMRTWGADTPRW